VREKTAQEKAAKGAIISLRRPDAHPKSVSLQPKVADHSLALILQCGMASATIRHSDGQNNQRTIGKHNPT
jgi:hypothetical protein